MHRNDRAQIKRALAGSGQALLPMLEMIEGAQASIDKLMHETAVALVWHVASAYPARGQVAEVKFGDLAIRLNFVDNRTMNVFERHVRRVRRCQRHLSTTPAVEVIRNVFMVYWHEPGTGSNVFQVQDWNTGAVQTTIPAKDGSLTNLKGTIRIE